MKDERILREVLKQIKVVKNAMQIIDIIQALELSDENTKRVLDNSLIAYLVKGSHRGGQADPPKGFQCKQVGYTKAEGR